MDNDVKGSRPFQAELSKDNDLSKTEQTRRVVEAMVDGLNDHEIDGMEKFFSESFRWMGNAGCGFKNGLKEFQDNWQRPFQKAFFDKVCIDEARLAEGEWMAAFGRQEAIHSGEFMGIAPTWKRVEIRYMDFWKVINGKIVDNWVMVDFPHVMRQLGRDPFNGLGWEIYDSGGKQKLLNVFVINSAHIYLYNDLSITSVHKTLDLSNDYNYIRTYEHLFSDIKKFYKSKWDILKLPFKYIDSPFNIKFDDYKIENNNIKIIDYCKYLENINSKYIIEFCNNLVLKIYNIFKSNIDHWLCSNNIKAFELCSKLIENNIKDRDIFTYICVYGVLNRKIDIVYKYINDAYPISKNYTCLLKYI